MKDKIRQLMNSEGLTSSRFAEILEIQPSGVSHLLSGRNKPGFELLQKILTRFPRVSPDWLLMSKGEIYRDDFEPHSLSSGEDDLFGDALSLFNDDTLGDRAVDLDDDDQHSITPAPPRSPTRTAPSLSVDYAPATDEYIPSWESAKQPAVDSVASAFTSTSASGAKVRSVVIFYEDGSCESFRVR